MTQTLVSIIIPAYDEPNTLASVVADVQSAMQRAIGFDYEIIVVCDGSREDAAIDLSSFENLSVLRNPYRLGYGASIKRGIRASNGQLIGLIDADDTYPAEMIPALLSRLSDYDMVVGARDSRLPSMGRARRAGRWILTCLAEFLAGQKIPDINSGLRVFKKELGLNFLHLFPAGFSLTTTLTLACLTNDYTISYVKIGYRDRKGESKIRPLVDFWGFLLTVIRVVTYFKPLKIFALISGIMMTIPLALMVFSLVLFRRVMFDLTIITLFLLAVQVFCLGLLADIIARGRSK